MRTIMADLETPKDLLNAIILDQGAMVGDTLNTILMQKISNEIDEKREEVAKQMFSGVNNG